MKISKLNFLNMICLCFAFSLVSTLSAAPGKWELIKQKRGVTVYKKQIPGSKFLAVKGQTIMEQPIETIFGVLLDNTRRTEWVNRLKRSEIIEQVSPLEYVVYQEFKLPWPFKNRDFVYRGLAQKDHESGAITLQMNSIEHKSAPPSVGVRADLKHSFYKLTPLGNGKTFVEVEIHSDPKGLIPAWLINLIQRNWPIKTLHGILKQSSKLSSSKVTMPTFPKKDKGPTLPKVEITLGYK